MTPHAPPSIPLPRRPIGLTLPFAAIGFAGSTVVAETMFGPHAGALEGARASGLGVPAVIVGTATAMSALLGRGARDPAGKSVFLNGFLLAAACAVAGALSGAIAGGLAGLFDPGFLPVPVWALVPAGGYLGLLLAAAFFVPLAAVFFTRRTTGEARPGSILAGSERQRVWVATTSIIALGAICVRAPLESSHAVSPTLFAIAATASLALLAIAETIRLSGMLAVVRGVDRIAEAHEVPAGFEVDVGIGDERWTSRVASGAPYRGVARVERSVRGAIFDVQRRLTRAVLVDYGLFGACLVLLLLAIGTRRPSPAVVGVAHPASPIPKVASTLPPAGMRWLSWYPLSPPILVDINGDGREDIVGLRWNSGEEARALSVTATDGATLAPMWQSPPIPCQWANPHVKLLRSDDRLFLADSEKLVHVYDLRTGKELGEPRTVPENATLTCARSESESETGETEKANPSAWLWSYPGTTSAGGVGKGAGYLVDTSGITVGVAQPKWCVADAAHPACGKRDKRDKRDKADKRDQDASVARACEAYHDYRLPPVAPKFVERYSLEERDAGVAVGFRRVGDSWVQADTLVGYDPKTRKVRWDQPVARELEPHAFPRVQTELSGGKVFTFYQGATGAWELSARDARTGDAMWATVPPRALEGTSFDSMTITAEGVYLGLSNRLEVFDPATGASRGVIW